MFGVYDIFLICCGLLGVLYIYITWNNTYWKKKGVPYKEPEFFFGNFKEAFLGKKNFGIIYKDLYKDFPNASIVGLHVLRNTSILIRDLDIIKNVLVTNFASFTDNDFEVNLNVDKIWATNPFSNKGEQWKAVRNRWIPHLTQAKLKLTFNPLLKKKKDFIDNLNEELKNNSNKEFTLKNLVSNFFLDYIIYGVFGLEINSFESADNIFKQIKDKIFVSNFWDALVIHSFMVAPWLGNFISTRFVSKEMTDKLLTAAREIIQLRKQSGQPNTDIYETLQKYSEQDGKTTFSDWDLAGRIFGVMLDGSETTSNPMVMGLYELACHPEIQERLRAEVDEAYKAGGGEISFDEIHKLPYLEQVSSEILRLYAPLSHLSRLCTKDTTIHYDNKTIDVKEGTVMVVPVYALHTDPLYYPDPYKFNPERFAEGAKEKIPKFAYMPFGEGPRICSGMRLGILESKMLIASIIRNFQLTPNFQMPRPIPMDPNVFVYRSSKELTISLKPIK